MPTQEDKNLIEKVIKNFEGKLINLSHTRYRAMGGLGNGGFEDQSFSRVCCDPKGAPLRWAWVGFG